MKAELKIYSLLLLLCLGIGSLVRAQTLYHAIGLNASWLQLEGVNSNVDLYNRANFLEKELGELCVTSGMSVQVGLYGGNALITMDYSRSSQRTKATRQDDSPFKLQVVQHHLAFNFAIGNFEKRFAYAVGPTVRYSGVSYSHSSSIMGLKASATLARNWRKYLSAGLYGKVMSPSRKFSLDLFATFNITDDVYLWTASGSWNDLGMTEPPIPTNSLANAGFTLYAHL